MFDIFIYKSEHMKNYKYHYFYKIENIINGNYYYGIHSTNNLDDKYMGSGRRLKEAMKIFGKENFIKNIVKFFDSREKASEFESLMVTESLVTDKNCYNVKCGGDYGLTSGTILVKDINNTFTRVTYDDERYKNGELVNFMTGLVSVYDTIENKYKTITTLEYYSNKKRYIHHTNGKVTVKDDSGKIFQVSINDKRYRNGDVVTIWSGKKHSQETKLKMSTTHKKNKDQKGEKNSQYGTCWVYKDGENKKIKLSDITFYLDNGWKRGRKIGELKQRTNIDKEQVHFLMENGKSIAYISSILKIPKTTLYRFIKRNNMGK